MIRVALHLVWVAVLIGGLHYGPGGVAPLGSLLDPARGLYHNARIAEHGALDEGWIPSLTGPVTIERDERSVPHIFATSDQDAIRALGYVTAQDRLFQMDFVSRVAAGRMSEVFGPESIETDRYLRGTGMRWAAKNILQFHAREKTLDYQIMQWFADGVNAYLHSISSAEWPFEFKLFGYAPEKYTPMHMVLLMQYFNFDLSFDSDDAAYGLARDRLGAEEYADLYPRYATRYRPMIPGLAESLDTPYPSATPEASSDGLALLRRMHDALKERGIEGYRPSKGSNSWGVTGNRSATGSAILAGDIHLGLSLPSIWYEAHLVTPSINTYGVLAPGAPLLIEAFNDHVSWMYTSAAIDGIDHYLLHLSEDGLHYEFDGAWRALDMQPDTIHVKGADNVIDTLVLSHLGPVLQDSSTALAIRWVAQEQNNSMRALWEMNHAENAAQVDSALQYWHSPAMNVLYADHLGHIGVRTSGFIPIRASGHGIGILDGRTSATEWTGSIPFADLPHASRPPQEYLTSTNQQPVPETYPYYLNHDWPAAYRSLRIEKLLSSKEKHTVADLTNYQSDVYVGQYDAFVPLLESVLPRTPRGEKVRKTLINWDGYANAEATGPLALHEYLTALKGLMWDEAVFEGIPEPSETVLARLLEQGSVWTDVRRTPVTEDAQDLMALALEDAAHVLESQYGDDWRWDSHHRVIFRHLTQTPALDMLWRGPYSYPGYDETLGPADGLEVTHSASWRMVVDFSVDPPTGIGMYAGGQSGNPLSIYYDLHIQDYLRYKYYPLHRPGMPGDLNRISAILTLTGK